MKWGSIVRVDLNPVIGSEANKIRPALVVCNTRAITAAQRTGRGVISVLPITSNIEKIYAFQVLIEADNLPGTGLDVESKIQAEQIRSVDIQRITSTIGELSNWMHPAVCDAIALHLDLDRFD